MRKSRFSNAQIIGVIKEHDAGAATKDLCRKHGISTNTFYKWKAKFGGMEVSDVTKMRALQDENKRLRKVVYHVRSHLGRLSVPRDCADVFSRRVVGWAMATHLHTELVLDALNMPAYRRRPNNVIHHSCWSNTASRTSVKPHSRSSISLKDGTVRFADTHQSVRSHRWSLSGE